MIKMFGGFSLRIALFIYKDDSKLAFDDYWSPKWMAASSPKSGAVISTYDDLLSL